MNPFAALQVSDDEDDYTRTNVGGPKPPKKTHQERKLVKETKIREAQTNSQPVSNPDIAEKTKENLRNKRYHQVIPPKEVPANGHYLDRRSGTGRVDKPKKDGGGRGGVGNLHDELIKDKYAPDGKVEANEENEENQVAEVPEPEVLTLEEYYKNKGINVEETQAQQKIVKKNEVSADWIGKEKLTILQTKEDKKAAEEGEGKKGKKREFNDKVGLSNDLNSEYLGFNSQKNKNNENREDKNDSKGGKKDDKNLGKKNQQKVVLSQEDFPSL